MSERQEMLRAALPRLRACLERAGVWHCLAFGTLLGAVREGDVIEWDHDLDLLVRPADVARICAVDDGEFAFAPGRLSGSWLALDPGGVTSFWPGTVLVRWQGSRLGELWAHTLFADGLLRSYDLAEEVYVWPGSSFPHHAVAALSEVRLGGAAYPAPRDPEQWLRWIYGDDWATPRRAPIDGGESWPGRGYSGEVTTAGVADRVAECVAAGWDVAAHRHEPAWPRTIRGAGPPSTDRDHPAGDGWSALADLAERY